LARQNREPAFGRVLMTVQSKMRFRRKFYRRASRTGLLIVMGAVFFPQIPGCGVFNPAFVNLFETPGTDSLATIDNAPGHVIVAFVNNAEVDERLLTFLESPAGGGLVLTDEEKRQLRPRVRFRVLITFVTGDQQEIEFVDGSTTFVQPGFNAQSEPDLNQNTQDNVVVVCDVAAINVMDPIEVFIPVTFRVFDFVEPTGLMPGFFRTVQTVPPQFEALEVDDVDQDLNTILQRNIGFRDSPAPVDNLQCGSVVTIVLTGVLSIPFFDLQGGVPGFDALNLISAASLGGRYEFRVSVR